MLKRVHNDLRTCIEKYLGSYPHGRLKTVFAKHLGNTTNARSNYSAKYDVGQRQESRAR